MEIKGIDVSKYQGEINWERVAASGVQFAFIRVGWAGYLFLTLTRSVKAYTNIQTATIWIE